MLSFFYALEDIQFKMIQDGGFMYIHNIHTPPDIEGKETPFAIPYENVFVSTPSNLYEHRKWLHMVRHKDPDLLKLIAPEDIRQVEGFPEHIGFQPTRDWNEMLEPFKKKGSIKIAITNAMSSALGDHLIGCRAYCIFYQKLLEHFPKDKIHINLFQLNPFRIESITAQWKEIYTSVKGMPINLGYLMTYDAFVDFGGLILYENFDGQPMIDFYLEGFSIDKTTVSDEQKRLVYTLTTESENLANMLMKRVRKRADGRPVLLFHHSSTSPIRSMDKDTFHKILHRVFEHSDYFVISAFGTEDFKHERFMNLQKFSKTSDDFAAILSMVDGIISVDTLAYHLADAFSIPAVAMFTSIPPEWRIKYYPYVDGIMLEEENGPLFGKHKVDRKDEFDTSNEEELEENKKQIEELTKRAKELWDQLDIQGVLARLQIMRDKKASDNQ